MSVNTLEKNSVLKYFEILKEKFFKIVLLNMFYFTALTLIFIVIMGISYTVTSIFGDISDLWTILTFSPIVFLGPFTSAVIKILRDFVRQEPCFFFEDFKNAFKQNFKQSIIIASIQYVVTWVVVIAARFYYVMSEQGIFYTIGFGVSLFVALAILVASYYLYMMIVTLKLKVKEIIKNSLIFSMLCIGRNIVLTLILVLWVAINAAIVYFTIISGNAFVYGLMLMFFMILSFGIAFYTIAFFAFPPIKKYILDPYYEAHPEESSKSVLDNVDSSEINIQSTNESEKEIPEFVYHNGRMIHRDALEAEKVFSDKQIIDNDD